MTANSLKWTLAALIVGSPAAMALAIDDDLEGAVFGRAFFDLAAAVADPQRPCCPTLAAAVAAKPKRLRTETMIDLIDYDYDLAFGL